MHFPRLVSSLMQGSAILLLLLLAAEGVVRSWLVSPAAPKRFTGFGWVDEPLTPVVHSREGYSRNVRNGYGLVDEEPRTSARARRLLVLGDSYGEALQVAGPERFHSVLEASERGLEAINAARSGLTLLHHAAYLPALVSEFHPDAVVVQINDGELDDLGRWVRPGETPEETLARFRRAELRVHEPRSGLLALPEALARRSGLATFVYRRLVLLTDKEKQRLSAKVEVDPPPETGGLDSLNDLVDFLGARLAAAGPRVVFLYIPNMTYGSAGCVNKWPDRRRFFTAFAERTGARFVDLSAPFRREFAATGRPLHGFHNSVMGTGHINAAGHRLAAAALRRVLHETLP